MGAVKFGVRPFKGMDLRIMEVKFTEMNLSNDGKSHSEIVLNQQGDMQLG